MRLLIITSAHLKINQLLLASYTFCENFREQFKRQ